MLSEDIERIGAATVDSAVAVHMALGPGLLERIYKVCLCHALEKRGLRCERRIDLPIVYDGTTVEEGLRLDIQIEKEVICERKAVDNVHAVWEVQLVSHLRLTNCRLGYVLNLNVVRMRDGIKNMVL